MEETHEIPTNEIPKKNGKERRLKNLHPQFSKEYQPDHPGRPKGSVSIMARVREMLQNGTELEECAISLLKNMKKGNPVAVKELLGRIDGPLAEKHEHDLTENLMAAVVAALTGPKANE